MGPYQIAQDVNQLERIHEAVVTLLRRALARFRDCSVDIRSDVLYGYIYLTVSKIIRNPVHRPSDACLDVNGVLIVYHQREISYRDILRSADYNPLIDRAIADIAERLSQGREESIQ